MREHDLIHFHMPFAEKLAKIKKRSVNRNIYYEELESAAYRGLVDAAKGYDYSGPFEKFAIPRIVGEMNDYLREIKWGSRNRKMGICPISEKIADRGYFYHENLRSEFDSLLGCLSEEDKQIFSWYYDDGLTLQEIGTKLGMDASSVSRIMSKCRDNLRHAHCR